MLVQFAQGLLPMKPGAIFEAVQRSTNAQCVNTVTTIIGGILIAAQRAKPGPTLKPIAVAPRTS